MITRDEPHRRCQIVGSGDCLSLTGRGLAAAMRRLPDKQHVWTRYQQKFLMREKRTEVYYIPTPSTLAISSQLSKPSTVSIWTAIRMLSLAVAVYSLGVCPNTAGAKGEPTPLIPQMTPGFR